MTQPSITNADAFQTSIFNGVWSADRDRAMAALCVPSERRDAVMAVLAFNADLGSVAWQVSEPLIGRMRFQWWRDQAAAIAAGTPPVHMTAQALSRASVQCGLGADALVRLIDAREDQFLADQPETLEALVASVTQIEGTVFRLVASVLSDTVTDSSDAATEAADALGVAWGLLGLVRAVPTWASARRCALPSELCQQAELDVEVLYANGPGTSVRTVCQIIATEAGHRLSAARAVMPQVHKPARAAFLPAVIAASHLRRLSRAGFDPFDSRVQSRTVSPSAVVGLVANSLMRRY